MKINKTQYAQALYELTKGKSKEEMGSVIEKFVANLQKNGFLNMGEGIIEKFQEIYDAKEGIVRAKIYAGRELDDEIVSRIIKAIQQKYQAKKVEWTVVVEKNLKGGLKIVVGEDVFDATIAGRLKKLEKALS